MDNLAHKLLWIWCE